MSRASDTSLDRGRSRAYIKCMSRGKHSSYLTSQRTAGSLKQLQQSIELEIDTAVGRERFLADIKNKLVRLKTAAQWKLYWQDIGELRAEYQENHGNIVIKFFDFSSRDDWDDFELSQIEFNQCYNTKPVLLQKAIFTNMIFQDSIWKDINMYKASFNNCFLRGNTFISSWLHDCAIIGTSISSSLIESTVFDECTIEESSFKDNYFKRVEFRNCSITKSKYRNNHFAERSLLRQNLVEACEFKSDRWNDEATSRGDYTYWTNNTFSESSFSDYSFPPEFKTNRSANRYDLCLGIA